MSALRGPGVAVVGGRRLDPVLLAVAALPPEMATAGAGQPVVGCGPAPGGPVFGAAVAVGGFVTDELAAVLVADVPDGLVGAGGVEESAEFGDGPGGSFDAGAAVVADGDDEPDAFPPHPNQNRTHVRTAVKVRRDLPDVTGIPLADLEHLSPRLAAALLAATEPDNGDLAAPFQSHI